MVTMHQPVAVQVLKAAVPHLLPTELKQLLQGRWPLLPIKSQPRLKRSAETGRLL